MGIVFPHEELYFYSKVKWSYTCQVTKGSKYDERQRERKDINMKLDQPAFKTRLASITPRPYNFFRFFLLR
jgi:hypothetical protein